MSTGIKSKTVTDSSGKTHTVEIGSKADVRLSGGNSAPSKSTAPIVSPSGSYGTDKQTGKPVSAANDTPSGPRTPDDVAPLDITQSPQGIAADARQNALQSVPGGPEAPVAGGVIKDPVTGNQYQKGPTGTYQKYQTALAGMQGKQVPSEPGAARSMASGMLPQEPDTSAVDQYVSTDPGVTGLMKGITELLNPQMQTTSLLDDYKKLQKESGLDEINQEIIDADTVINGTEDDIRNEIQTAGGFGTESQVQAMALSRNKSLLKRYNQLVQMKTDATNQLNTLSNLNAQDKQMAQQRLNSQIDTMFKLANFQQQAQNNIKEGYRWMLDKMGADGVYNAYSQDPRQLKFLEKSLGLVSGGLQSLAGQATQEKARIEEDRQLDRAVKSANLKGQQLQNEKLAKDLYTPPVSPLQISQMQSEIKSVDDLRLQAQGGAVGPTPFARHTPFNEVTSGSRSNFIAGVEQLTSQLTLDKLNEAKKNGTTFGALSDSEREGVAAAASKIGTWTVKDNAGKVTGYNTTKQAFNAELDRINNFKKLDYVLKGGDPTSIGLQETPDGKYYVQNSNGSVTFIQ